MLTDGVKTIVPLKNDVTRKHSARKTDQEI